MYECDCCKMHKANSIVKQHLRETFPNNMPLREETTLEIIKSGSLLGYVQCDIEVTENLREAFANFPPIFRNTIVCRDEIDPFMGEYTEKEGLLTQPRGMQI